MDRKRRKKSVLTILLFVIGLVTYLVGLLLIFGSGISKMAIVQKLFSNLNLSVAVIKNMKIMGAIMFIGGFAVFMISIVFLYKNDNIQEDSKNLIIEGKADVITLIVMNYIMMFMVVICLLYNELIGALLFGVAIVIQSVLNGILINYYNKNYGKK